MFIAYFTEQPDSSFPQEIGDELGYTALLLPNKYFNAEAVSELYQLRLREYQRAEEVGFDGIMLNEHHNAPFCLQSKCNIFAAVLAAATDHVWIELLGNPLPVSDNPVRLAEEIGMLDLISKGRIISGFVRGGGTEQISTNANPAYNRERFVESHDLIVKTWMEPGPWRWEGNHFQMRVVNPWIRPLQKPHPRIWMPGVASKETVIFAAEHRYPFVALSTTFETTKKIWDLYDQTARAVGYEPGPETKGYELRVHVQDTEEKAIAAAQHYMWMQGEFTGVTHPVWHNPSGYGSPTWRRQFVEMANGRRKNVANVGKDVTIQDLMRAGNVIVGTPDQVIEGLKRVLDELRPGILNIWCNDGRVSHETGMRCIELMGQEVLPVIRRYADELGLNSPFDIDAPVSLATTPQAELQPVGA